MTAGAHSPEIPVTNPIDDHDSCWYLAQSAGERMAAGAAEGPTDTARGARRLATYRKEPVFANEADRWTGHLARLGLDEDGFAALLGEPPDTVRSRSAGPLEYAAVLAGAWERYDENVREAADHEPD